ncbi:MAG: sulfotransferase [Balneolaceae bacterium]|nr:sulfotransferase [Balneolaceae bacterium]
MSISHNKLNEERSEQYRKPPEEEQFLEQLNDHLISLEQETYRDISPQFPFLFVIGPPRSGTTLLSQLVAHCLDVGYINNLAARFWKAPVTGIKFSRSVLDMNNISAFKSHYGATKQLADIHEFGYFWRHWLKKDSFKNIKNARQIEDHIDWNGLQKTLGNMQAQFNKPMVFKNIFGSYHIPKLNDLLGQTLWLYIERDPLDTAISILKARQKYYRGSRQMVELHSPSI